MATRFYFSNDSGCATSDNFTGISPGWGATGRAGVGYCLFSSSGIYRRVTGSIIDIGAGAGSTALDRVYISEPLASGLITGYASGQLMVREYAANDNTDRVISNLYIIDKFGNFRGSLLNRANYGTTLEFISNISHRNHMFASGTGRVILNPVTGQYEDRLVLEIGFSNSTAGTTPQASAIYGTSGMATFLPHNNSTTALQIPWFDISSNIKFIDYGTIQGVANLRTQQTENQQGVASIAISNDKIQQGVARISVSESKNQQGVANIFTPSVSVDNYIQGKSTLVLPPLKQNLSLWYKFEETGDAFYNSTPQSGILGPLPFVKYGDPIQGGGTGIIGSGVRFQNPLPQGQSLYLSGLALSDSYSTEGPVSFYPEQSYTVNFWVIFTGNLVSRYLFNKHGRSSFGGGEQKIGLETNADSKFEMFHNQNGYRTGTVSDQIITGFHRYFVSAGYNAFDKNIFLKVNDSPTKYQLWTGGGLTGADGSPIDTTLFLGGTPYSANLQGVIDEFSFWRRPLSESDIATLYNNGAGLTFEDLYIRKNQQGIASINAAAIPYTYSLSGVSNIKVLPEDNFNRPDEDPITGKWSYATDTEGYPIKIKSNQVVRDSNTSAAGTDATIYWNGNEFSNNQFSEIDYIKSDYGYDFGPAVLIERNANTKNFYWFSPWPNQLSLNLAIFNNNSISTLGSKALSTPVVSGDKLRIEKFENKINAYHSGKLVFSVENTSIQTGSPGIFVYDNATGDNWRGGSIYASISSGVSRITNNYISYQSGKSNILASQIFNQQGLSKISASNYGNQSGKAYISKFLIDEGFEGVGTPPSFFGGGSADFDYTGLPLEGAQSLILRKSTNDYISVNHTPSEEIWSKMLFRFSGVGDFSIELLDSDFNSLSIAGIFGGNAQYFFNNITPYEQGASPLSANTNYYSWIRFKKGTGNNAQFEWWLNTTDNRSSSFFHKTAAGGIMTGIASKQRITVSSGDLIIDNFQIANTEQYSGYYYDYNQSGAANIRNYYYSNQLGTSSVKNSLYNAQSGLSRITSRNAYSISGLSRIFNSGNISDETFISSNTGWYSFRLVDDDGYRFDIDQFPVFALSGQQSGYWILKYTGTNSGHKVYLTTDDGYTSLNVAQDPTGAYGDVYKLVKASDNTYHKISIIYDEGYRLDINQDNTYDYYQSGRSRLQKTFDNTINGISRLSNSYVYNQSGLARVTSSNIYYISGISKILKSNTNNQSGVSNIKLLPIDDFNRPNEIPINTGNWVNVHGLSVGVAVLSGNQIYKASGDQCTFYWNGNSFKRNQFSQIQFITGTLPLAAYKDFALSLNHVFSGGATGTSYYEAYFYQDNLDFTIDFFRYNNIVPTNIGSTHFITQPIATGDIFRFEIVDNSLRVLRNNNLLASESVDYYLSGNPGFTFYRSNIRLDNWEGGSISTNHQQGVANISAAEIFTYSHNQSGQSRLANTYSNYNTGSYRLIRYNNLRDQLTAYWKFNEYAGTRYDSHNSNHFNLTGSDTPSVPTGELALRGSGARFISSVPQWLETNHSTDIEAGDIDFSISLWVKYNSIAGFPTIFSKTNVGNGSPGNRSYQIYTNNGGGINFVVRTQSETWVQVGAGGALSTGVWYHVYAYHDKNADQIGVVINNGTPATTTIVSGVKDAPTIRLMIGREEGASNNLDGTVDEVSFHKRVLNSDEITYLYNAGYGLTYEDFSLQPQRSIQGVSNITLGTTYNSISGQSRISNSYFNNISGASRVQNSYLYNNSGAARITNSASRNQQGLYRINVINNNTISGLARLTNNYFYNTTGIARITYSYYNISSGISRIQNSFSNNLNGITRITNSNINTQNGLSRITISNNYLISGISRLSNTYLYNQSGLARVTNNYSSNVSGGSRITNTYNYGESGKARITNTYSFVLSGVGRITNYSNSNILGLSRITSNYRSNQFGISRVSNSYNYTESGKSRIKNSYTNYTSGASRITNNYNSYLTGISRIKITDTDNQSGQSRITNSYSSNQFGVSRITNSYNLYISGKSRIANVYSNYQSGAANLLKSFIYNESGKARITNYNNQNISGAANIFNYTINSIQGKAAIIFSGTIDYSINGVSRLANTYSNNLSGTSRISTTKNNNQQGLSRINTTVDIYLNGRGCVYNTNSSALQSTDSGWYFFNLRYSDGVYALGLNQYPITQPSGESSNWVLNLSGSGYRVGLSTNTGTLVTSFAVDQSPTGVLGEPYKLVWANDWTQHKVYITGREDFLTLAINQDATNDSYIRGVSTIANQTGSFYSFISGAARISNTYYNNISGAARVTNSYNYYQSGKTRITNIYLANESGIARIQASNNYYISGRSRLTNSYSFNQQGVSRVTNSYTNNQNGVSRITKIDSKNQNGISRVKNTYNNNQFGVSRILVSSNKNQSGLSRIKNTYNNSLSGKAYLLVQGQTSNYQSGASSIRNNVYNAQLGKSSVLKSFVINQSGLSRINIVRDLYINGKSNLRNSYTANNQGIARIKSTYSNYINGSSRITSVFVKNQNGSARITNSSIKNQQGLSRVKNTYNNSLSGLGRVNVVNSINQSGKANIVTTGVSYNLNGISRIKNSYTNNQSGQSNITTVNLNNQQGISKIILPNFSYNQFGVARVLGTLSDIYKNIILKNSSGLLPKLKNSDAGTIKVNKSQGNITIKL